MMSKELVVFCFVILSNCPINSQIDPSLCEDEDMLITMATSKHEKNIIEIDGQPCA